MVDLDAENLPTRNELVELYDAVGWTAYTKDPEGLARAVGNSTCVATLRDGDRLIGFVRGLTDDVSILYVQDIIIHPEYQGRGLGKRLLEHIVERFPHVRTKVLMTDDEERQHRLYRSLGFRDIVEIERLHAFARFDEQRSNPATQVLRERPG